VAYFAASTDDVETNTKFAESLELDYPILSDPEGTTAKAYGVLMDNGKYASRHTVYIGADGNILLVDRDVNPATAGQDVAAHLEKLGVPRR
jgi:peroxiredoxin Q/BCP